MKIKNLAKYMSHDKLVHTASKFPSSSQAKDTCFFVAVLIWMIPYVLNWDGSNVLATSGDEDLLQTTGDEQEI